MTDKKVYGHTKSGTPITDELVEQLADEAERGYDVDELITRRGKRGRPRLGSAPSTVESVRLDPEMKARLLRLPTRTSCFIKGHPRRPLFRRGRVA